MCIRDRLSEAQQAALKKAVEMGQQFAANPTSPVIWEHLISLAEQVNAAVCGQHSYLFGMTSHFCMYQADLTRETVCCTISAGQLSVTHSLLAEHFCNCLAGNHMRVHWLACCVV